MKGQLAGIILRTRRGPHKFVQTNNKSYNRSPQREKYPRRDEQRQYYPRRHRDDDRRPEKQPRRSETPRRVEPSRRSGREVIDTIAGGFTCGGYSHLRAIQLVNSNSVIA